MESLNNPSLVGRDTNGVLKMPKVIVLQKVKKICLVKQGRSYSMQLHSAILILLLYYFSAKKVHFPMHLSVLQGDFGVVAIQAIFSLQTFEFSRL